MEPEHASIDGVDGAEAEPGVSLRQLVAGERMNAQHFQFEPGATASEHSHPNEQIAFVYEGTLTLIVDGEEYVLSPGDSLLVPGGAVHAAENRGDDPVAGLDVFGPPREETPWDD